MHKGSTCSHHVPQPFCLASFRALLECYIGPTALEGIMEPIPVFELDSDARNKCIVSGVNSKAAPRPRSDDDTTHISFKASYHRSA